MKKLGFLLAIAALFAMSTVAFAAAEKQDAKSVGKNGFSSRNMGNFKGTASNLDADPKTNGAYTADVYYFGVPTEDNTAQAAVVLFAGAVAEAGGTKFMYTVNDGAFSTAQEFGTVSASEFRASHTFDITNTDVVKYTIGADGGTKFVDNMATVSLTLTPVQVKPTVSADGKAVPGMSASLGRAMEKQVLSVDLDVVKAASAYDTYTLVLVSSDKPLSVDKVAVDDDTNKKQTLDVDGVKFELAIDTNKDLVFTVEGTPTEEGTYTVAVVSDDEPVLQENASAKVANPIKMTDKTKTYNCLTTFTLTVTETPSGQIIDIISADAALSADVVALLSNDKTQAAKGILLTVSGDEYILNGENAAPQVLSDDTAGKLDMTLAFLTLDASGRLVVSADAPANVYVDIRRDVDSEARTASFDINGGTGARVDVVDGVAQVQIKNKTATTDGYTAYIVNEAPVTGGTIRGAATPAADKVYRSQKFQVKVSSPQGKTDGSSGACSMGAGLAALAGLVLVLRKKD